MFSNKNLISLILLNFVFYSTSVKEIEIISKHRDRRQLLWPNSTIFQVSDRSESSVLEIASLWVLLLLFVSTFNVGIGFPSAVKNINVNYVFQANFQLPWNRTQIPLDILHANTGYTGTSRMKRELALREEENGNYRDDAKLYHFYKHIEGYLDGFGHNGHSCMLQTLCQLGSEPLHTDDEEDLLHEMVSFVLNPTNDASHQLTEGDENYPYMKAYMDGQTFHPCTKLYEGCSLSLIDMLTKVHDSTRFLNSFM